MKRKTKIIATVGPSVDSKNKIHELIDSGADVIRLNFSHGSHEDHKNIVDWVRDYPKSIAIMQDIQGPKIRTGISQEGTFLEAGQVIELTSKESNSTDKSIFINYENLLTDIKPGERIFIDDGQVVMRVIELIGKKMTANIEIGGELRDNQGVAFPDSKLSVSAITLKDKEDLAYGKKIGVDIVAVSFVRKASDITEVKALVESNIKIIAKIELKEAMKNLDSIIDESDGVMVARGDLGVQLPLEQVPFAQKKILDTANYKGKISITATEMLQSMKISFRPTRAEVTDITNAILDGTDAVMLSAETSIGDHPNNVVKVMASICEEADSNSHYSSMRFKTLSSVDTFATSLAKAAVQVANDIDAKAIVAYTETGSTPLLISNFRPSAPIITFSAKDLTL